MKKIFTITETKPATYIWTYEVEAESEEEALHKVLSGEVDPGEADFEIDDDEESSFDVERKLWPKR